MASVDDVAAAVLARSGPVTTMKLQKLIYYCQAWHLVRTHQALFADRIEAWPQGPVVPSVYRRHRRRYSVSSWDAGNPDLLTASERDTVAWVLGKYGHMSAESLSKLTHIEPPWRIAREESPGGKGAEEIPQERLRYYYARQVADVESAVSHAAASAAMEGVDLDADWQDELRAVASGECSAAEAVQREIDRVRNS
ncbi:hypothetical protein GCM10029964_003450 [Kibdelosporangium lantanae]